MPEVGSLYLDKTNSKYIIDLSGEDVPALNLNEELDTFYLQNRGIYLDYDGIRQAAEKGIQIYLKFKWMISYYSVNFLIVEILGQYNNNDYIYFPCALPDKDSNKYSNYTFSLDISESEE